MERLDYNKLLELLRDEFVEVMQSNPGLYQGHKIAMDIEQQFIHRKNLDPTTIYLVVNFMPSTILYGQTALPCSITLMGEENSYNIGLKLLIDFAETYNLKRIDNGKIQQIFQLPSVNRNFNAASAGFRSIMRLSGTLIITEGANYYSVKYFDTESKKWADTPFIASNFGFSNTLDSQVFYGTKNFPESVSKYGTISLSISTYLLTTSALMNKALDIATKKFEVGEDGTDTTFDIRLEFTNGSVLEDKFKLVNFQVGVKQGDIPSATLSFTN